jgi:hypothetical protein
MHLRLFSIDHTNMFRSPSVTISRCTLSKSKIQPPYGKLNRPMLQILRPTNTTFNHVIMVYIKSFRIYWHFMNSILGLIRYTNFLLYAVILYMLNMVTEGDRNM